MSARFLSTPAKDRITQAVKKFESFTSAELVVTVKKSSGRHPEASLRWGAAWAFLALVVLMFHPEEFDLHFIVVDVGGAFLLGYALSAYVTPVKRVFITPRARAESVRTMAKAAFYDLGISGTFGRTGLLAYVSSLENTIEIVCDRGVTDAAREACQKTRPLLERCLHANDYEGFAKLLEALGETFHETMPRATDDVNELVDEVA